MAENSGLDLQFGRSSWAIGALLFHRRHDWGSHRQMFDLHAGCGELGTWDYIAWFCHRRPHCFGWVMEGQSLIHALSIRAWYHMIWWRNFLPSGLALGSFPVTLESI